MTRVDFRRVPRGRRAFTLPGDAGTPTGRRVIRVVFSRDARLRKLLGTVWVISGHEDRPYEAWRVTNSGDLVMRERGSYSAFIPLRRGHMGPHWRRIA